MPQSEINGLYILSLIFSTGVCIATNNIGWGIAAFPCFITIVAFLYAILSKVKSA
jgi:hypothetical protein